MGKIALMIAMLFFLPAVSASGLIDKQAEITKVLKQQLLGSPVYIQIFKEERQLELYAFLQGKYRLVDKYEICNFSGGLGPKRKEGDFKSPEGFYSVDMRHLKPDSRYYRAINIGFPNEYDKAKGYSGKYLMIHGECSSIGCYAMTNTYMGEIYDYAQKAFNQGQSQINISIYPFRMTAKNMLRHRNSKDAAFWRELKPGYDYFEQYRVPPEVKVINGQYVVNRPLLGSPPVSEYAFSEAK